MFRNMVTSLFKYERIRTTDAKAKELRRWADHMVTLAKRGDLHARRQALSIIREKAVVHRLFEEASERFGGINGGYTRVVKLAHRPGDAAPISIVELVTSEGREKTGKKESKTDEVIDLQPEEPIKTDAGSPPDQAAALDEGASEPAHPSDKAAPDSQPDESQQDAPQESEEAPDPEEDNPKT